MTVGRPWSLREQLEEVLSERILGRTTPASELGPCSAGSAPPWSCTTTCTTPETARALLAQLREFVETAEPERGSPPSSPGSAALRSGTSSTSRRCCGRCSSDSTTSDDQPWAPEVSADPKDPHFGFSVGGTPFFIVGLHPRASREARRMPLPILVFNLHEQFEALRESGGFERMRDAIRRRDEELQGSVNPMVSDHGERVGGAAVLRPRAGDGTGSRRSEPDPDCRCADREGGADRMTDAPTTARPGTATDLRDSCAGRGLHAHRPADRYRIPAAGRAAAHRGRPHRSPGERLLRLQRPGPR